MEARLTGFRVAPSIGGEDEETTVILGLATEGGDKLDGRMDRDRALDMAHAIIRAVTR